MKNDLNNDFPLPEVGQDAMFMNERQEWIKAQFVSDFEDKFIYRLDDKVFFSPFIRKIPSKDDLNTFHIVYYTDNNKIVSRGCDIKAKSMIEALIKFGEKFNNIEPIYIIYKS